MSHKNQYFTSSDEKGLQQFYEDFLEDKNSNKLINKTLDTFQDNSFPSPITSLETFDDLKERDEQRAKDGFNKKLKIGKFAKPGTSGSKQTVIIIPSVEEDKLVHGGIDPNAPGSGTGQGEGEEGDQVGEESAEKEEGEEDGEGPGAGEGSGGDHEIEEDAYEAGKNLTEYFELPNLQQKGKKVAIPYYTEDLVSRNIGSGQILDKKATLKRVIATNLGLINKSNPKIDDLNLSNLIISPKDKVYRTFSKEKHYESQAVVFFIRDYSASMHGKPTNAVVSQHVMIYSWLMYQYGNRVIPRFILHDTEAKEVSDFNTYYKSKIAGGTMIASAYNLVNSIVEEENLNDYEIYIFQGTDGDDWRDQEDQAIEQIRKAMSYANRIGITVVRNDFFGGGQLTTFESNLDNSRLLDIRNLIRLDSMSADNADEERLVEGIRKLVSED